MKNGALRLWGLRHLAWGAFASACVMPQPSAAGPAQPTSSPVSHASATCPSVVGCYSQCTTNDCIVACESGVDPAIAVSKREVGSYVRAREMGAKPACAAGRLLCGWRRELFGDVFA